MVCLSRPYPFKFFKGSVFGLLKARFGSLRREMNIKLDNLPQCINSCFILLNFCEMRKGGELDKSLKLEKEFQPPIEKS